MVMKNCVVCGVEFDAKGAAKTCSGICRTENIRFGMRKWMENNREKNREHSSNWRHRNAHKHRESERKRRESDPLKHNANKRNLREENREKYLNAESDWRETNREKIRERDRKQYQANPEKFCDLVRSRRNKANYRKNVTRILYEET